MPDNDPANAMPRRPIRLYVLIGIFVALFAVAVAQDWIVAEYRFRRLTCDLASGSKTDAREAVHSLVQNDNS